MVRWRLAGRREGFGQFIPQSVWPLLGIQEVELGVRRAYSDDGLDLGRGDARHGGYQAENYRSQQQPQQAENQPSQQGAQQGDGRGYREQLTGRPAPA